MIRAYGPISTIAAGSLVAGSALAAAVVVCIVRLGWRASHPGGLARDDRTSFPLYLGLIGLQTLAAYGLNSGIIAQAPTIIRFVLFALLLPVALFGAFFHHEPAARYRNTVVALVSVWAALTVADNARVLREYLVAPPENNYREVTDYLVEHRIKYARAIYWDCYVISFLSGERVIVASTDKVRVGAYQARVDANAASAVHLQRRPCASGKVVSSWCLEDPLGR